MTRALRPAGAPVALLLTRLTRSVGSRPPASTALSAPDDLGMIMAWGRWLEPRLPPAGRRIPGGIWAASLTVVGLILLVYRET